MINVQAWAAANMMKLVLAGVIALALVGSHTGVYFYGKAVQKTSYAAAENKLLVKERELREKEYDLNAKEAELAAATNAAMTARIDRGLGELRDAIENAGSRSGCDLTDDELRALEDIAGQPRSAILP
jgi:hypothetical protein